MKNRDICLLMVIMMLGVSNIANAEDKNYSAEVPNVKNSEIEIKGNKDSLDKAVEFMNNKDYESAVAYLSAYIKSKPKKYEGYKLRGDAYYELRRYNLAEQDYQTAIDIKSSNDRFLTGTKVVGAVVLGADKNDQYQNPELGNIYGRLMYAQKALNNPAYETTYMKAFEYNSHIFLPQPKKTEIPQINCPQKYGKMLAPQGIDETLYGAIDDIENKHFNEAIYKIQNVISSYPKYYLGYYLNGVALAGLEREKEAIVEFEKALKLNPYDFESLASIGQIYFYNAEKTFSVADAKKSIEYFNKALKLNPNCYLYYFYIGLNELQMGSNDLAILNFNKAIKFKSNDYNSLYYKLIAQYIKGDYQSVVEGSTKLLYKHVSNYNSVLYLRALAYHKQAQNELALADLEQIQRSVNDIYNADVRVTSAKEKTLENYIYYLKAQILKSQGYGAVSDLMKAHQNPIVAKLSKIEASTDVYEKGLEQKVITMDTYNSYNDFYQSSLPKMLKSDLLITVDDIDKQYDYIRTTFDNLGITFEYQNPYYKMATIKDYVYKKYSSKLSAEDYNELISQVSEDLKQETVHVTKPILKSTTDTSDILIGKNQSSIAQMLATQSLGASSFQSVPNTVIDEFAKTDASNPKPVEVKKQAPEIKEVKSVLDEEKTIIDTPAKVENTSKLENIEKPDSKLSKADENNGHVQKIENKEDNQEEKQVKNVDVLEPETECDLTPVLNKNDKLDEHINKTSDKNLKQDVTLETPEIKADEKAEIKADEKAEIKADEKAEIKADEKAEIKADEKAEIKADEKAEIKADEKAEIKADEKAEIKADEKAEIKADEKAEIKADEKAEIKVTELQDKNLKKDEPKQVREIKEKHAKINPKEFDIMPKETPELDEKAEVIEFNHRDYVAEKEREISQAKENTEKQAKQEEIKGLENKVEKVNQDENISKEDKTEVGKSSTKEDGKIKETPILKEKIKNSEETISKNETKAETNNIGKEIVLPEDKVIEDKKVAVPVVVVPNIDVPKADKKQAKALETKEIVVTNTKNKKEDKKNQEVLPQEETEINHEVEQKVKQEVNQEEDKQKKNDLSLRPYIEIDKTNLQEEKVQKSEGVELTDTEEKLQGEKISKAESKELLKVEKEAEKRAKLEAKRIEKEQKKQEQEAKRIAKSEAKELARTEKLLKKAQDEVNSEAQEIEAQKDAEKLAIQKAKQKAKERAEAEKEEELVEKESFSIKKLIKRFISKVSGDTSQEYAKSDSNKTIIKKLKGD